MAHHKEQKTLCTVRCDEIIEDYAFLMDQIEAHASAEENGAQADVIEDEIPASTTSTEQASGIRVVAYPKHQSRFRRFLNRIDWDVVGHVAGFVAVAIPGVITAAGGYKR